MKIIRKNKDKVTGVSPVNQEVNLSLIPEIFNQSAVRGVS